MLRCCVWLAGGLIVTILATGCGGGASSSSTEICPAPGDGDAPFRTIEASGRNVRRSVPPTLVANAHGESVQLVGGEAEWCGLVADVFQLVTSDSPLVVSPGERITIPNPLRDHLVSAGFWSGVVTAEPTREPGLLRWPSGPGGGGSRDEAAHEFRFDDGGLSFVADQMPGRYVVNVSVQYGRIGSGAAMSARRDANYTLLLEVRQ